MTDSTALASCPFCGGEALARSVNGGILPDHIESVPERYYITADLSCEACGATVQGYAASDDKDRSLFSEAVEACYTAWNTRTERTCRMEYNEKASGDEIYPTEAYTCSSCRYVTLDGLPNYCPNCGAKVVG